VSGATSLAVVVAVRDGGAYLAEALASLAGHPEIGDVVVVDDGSTDGSAEIAMAFPGVRCIRQPPLGVGAARNRGIAATVSGLLGFLDADDLWPGFGPGGDPRLRALAEDAAADAAVGQLQAFRTGAGGKPETLGPPRPAMGSFPAGIFRRRLFELVGPVDESLKVGEDTDWFLRAWEKGAHFRWLADATVRYRRHAGNTTATTSALREGMARVVARRHVRLRRAHGPGSTIPKRLWPEFEELAALALARQGPAAPGVER